MRLIKRYSNRKLYDTQEKRYISLGHVAALIRAGEEVQILDHQSGEDLTAATLARILQRKSLPPPFLRSLIRLGGDAWEYLRASLDEARLEPLVSRGETALEEAQRLSEELAASALRRRQNLEVATMIKSIWRGRRLVRSKARNAARLANEAVVSCSSAMRRSRIPEREKIQSSLVSTNCAI